MESTRLVVCFFNYAKYFLGRKSVIVRVIFSLFGMLASHCPSACFKSAQKRWLSPKMILYHDSFYCDLVSAQNGASIEK